ncbi:MAG: transposase [Myxococcota bacterium]
MTERYSGAPQDAEAAARLLEGLLEGSGSLSRPDVVRALRMAVEALRKQHASFVRAATKEAPGRRGQRWSAEEDAKIVADYEAGVTVTDIAAEHGRSHNAILQRLAKLGYVPESTYASLGELLDEAVKAST